MRFLPWLCVAALSVGVAHGQGNSVPALGGGSIPAVASTAVEASHVLKASAGSLYGMSITTSTVAGYVLLIDATTAPADGAVTPAKCYQIPSGSTIGILFEPLAFTTGIVTVFSTTGCFTKTASATAYFSGEVK